MRDYQSKALQMKTLHRPMGSNLVKITPSPFLNVESRALTYQDDQERIFKKGLGRRLGSYILAHWILMKRRERALVQRANEAVTEGKAPQKVLEEVEMYIEKDSRKPHIKYHPKLLPKKVKPTRSRFKGPRLTQTAARRIQDSYERRERERGLQESNEEELSRSRISVRSHVWTDNSPRKATSKSKIKQQKRASSLPPSSTLSLQSITTAESSGIGLSRTSSMTSVTSPSHRTFYTRQRPISLDAEDISPDVSQEARGPRTKKMTKQGDEKSKKDQPGKEKQQNKSGWKHMCLAALTRSLQRKQEERNKQKRGKQREDTSGRRLPLVGTNMQAIKPKKLQQHEQNLHEPGQDKVKRQVHYQNSHEHVSQAEDIEEILLLQDQSQNEEWEHVKRPKSKRKQLKEKKEQGSQTRLSGPPRPRRLLLLRSGRNKIETSSQPIAGTSNSSSSGEKEAGSPEQQDEAIVGPSQRHSTNRISPEKQDTRYNILNRREKSGNKQSAKNKKSIDLSLSLDNQASTSEVTQESMPKPSKTLEIARKMSRRWIRAHSLDLGHNKDGSQQNPNLGGRTLSQDNSLEIQNTGEVQVHLCKNRSARSLCQEAQVQLSSAVEVEIKANSQQHQQPNRQNTVQTAQQCKLQNGEYYDESVSNPSTSRRRGSLSAELMGHQTRISAVRSGRKRSRSTDTGKQIRQNRSTDHSQSRTVSDIQSSTQVYDTEVHDAKDQENNERSFEDEIQISLQEHDATDYEFEDTNEGHNDMLPRNALEIGTAEVQIEAPLEGNSNLEDQIVRHPRRRIDQVRTVEVQGSRRPYSFSDRGRTAEARGGRNRGGSLERGRRAITQEQRNVRGSVDHIPQRTSMNGTRFSQSVDLGSPERERRNYYHEHINNDYDYTRSGYEHYSDRRHQTASLDRTKRETYTEYPRYDPPAEYSRCEASGRGIDYRYARAYSDREYPIGYVSDSPEPRYIRGYTDRRYTDRRYTAVPAEASYVGSYSEQNHHGRLVDAEYARGYIDRGYTGRSLDNEFQRGYIEHAYIPGRIMEYEQGYPDQIVTARRWKNEADWERGGRRDIRRYREAILAPHSTSLSASSPVSDHRAL